MSATYITVSGQDVARFLGQDDNEELIVLAEEHVQTVAAMVEAHTRGNGFTLDGEPLPDLQRVIIAATARLVANPEQLRYSAGAVSVHDSFRGFTLPELTILNRYRKRAW